MNRWLAALVVPVALVGLLTTRPAIAAGTPEAAQRNALTRAITIVDASVGTSRDIQQRAARNALAVLNSDPDLTRQPWLIDPLQGRSPNLVQERNRLRAALAALDSPGNAIGDATADRQALATVLADRRFHPQDLTSYLPAWLVPAAVLLISLVHAIEQMVSDLLDRLFRLLIDFMYSNTFTVIVLALTAVIVPTIILLYVRTVRGVLVAQSELPPADGVQIQTAPELLEAARRAAARREFRDACHFAFLAALRVVEDRVDVRLDYSATNREQLRRLANAPGPLARQYVDTLKPLIDRFDRVWYGQSFASDGDFREIYDLAARLGEVGR